MDIFQSQQEEKHPQKFRSKRRLNEDQVRLLERSFTTNKKLDTELKQKLANQLGVPPRQVAIWYQNKRARWKTQSLELDYNTNQVKLQIALADKRRLEKDVKQLREELRQTQEVLFALSNQKAMETNSTTVVSCNSYSTATTCCSDQNGYCSIFNFLHEDYNSVHRNHDDQPLQIDHELYACLIGDGDGGGGGGGSAWS